MNSGIHRQLAIFTLAIILSGCDQETQEQGQPSQENLPSATSVVNLVTKKQANRKAVSNNSAQEFTRNKSVSPPRRRNRVGHAISHVGHTYLKESNDLWLFFHDPADNDPVNKPEIKGNEITTGHDWLSKPTKRMVTYGTRRPSIALTNDLRYTIVGAIKLQPNRQFQQNHLHSPLSLSHGMPDLSQHLKAEWTGLCAAAAAADMLYFAALRNPQFTGGRPAGPGNNADKAANTLIATWIETDNKNKLSGSDVVSPSSLAGLMQNDEGKGATAIGIAAGLRDWLDNQNINNWRVDIDFLDDTVPIVESSIQQDWLLSLASLTSQGGGAVLLLWEGDDWANKEIGVDPDRAKDLDPRFEAPTILPSEITDIATPPKKNLLPATNSVPPSQEMTDLKQLLLDARIAISNGKRSKAKKIIDDIFQTGLSLRFEESQIDHILNEARQLSAKINQEKSRPIQLREGIPTEFKN